MNVEVMNRRDFCLSSAAIAVSMHARGLATLAPSASANAPIITPAEIEHIDHDRILRAANEYLSQAPITITATSSPRSKGGKHDYFSEGDYWWPDPKNPERSLHSPRRIFRSAELQRSSRSAHSTEPDCARADGSVAHYAGKALRGARCAAPACVVSLTRRRE